jgi:8-oxo-dGTP diphosphatase
MSAAAGRNVTRVAVGVLRRDDGSVLLADRPQGKPYAGYWEFPGGKIEPGEDVHAALARELHEEVGVDIGPSRPWVTFEFDYPHAYVELQFRLVDRWRGEPHSREGQRLRFVDPADEPPQPLLPAAVPALRWLRLPPLAVLLALPAVAPGRGGAGAVPGRATDGAPRLAVVDADWRSPSAEASLADLRRSVARKGGLLLACGTAAPQARQVDGVVCEPGALVEAERSATGWAGAWIDDEADLAAAAAGGFDFVLVRSAALANRLRQRPAAVPAFLPGGAGEASMPADAGGHGVWIDLRRQPGSAGGAGGH